MMRVYLDHSATTPMAPEVLEAMRPHFLENYGNASSVHESGRRAKAVLEESREAIASLIGARYDELVFTSGGTESDNHALKGAARARRKSGRDHLVVSAIEHHAVLHTAQSLRKDGWKVDLVRVDESGTIDLNHLQQLVSPTTALVSIMHANNEVGTIQPVREAAEIAHRAGALVHTDAVQSVGKIPVNVNDLGVDLLSMSAHKMYGPKGIGALYVKKGTVLEPILEGGGQEQNRRAGTENVPLAAGFAKAALLARELMDAESVRITQLRDWFRNELQKEFSGILLNGHLQRSLPGIVSVSFDSTRMVVDGEALIMGMDLEGVSVTSGSACTSGTLEPSHVLLAMGRDIATARATIRFSIGRQTTKDNLSFALGALRRVLEKLLVGAKA